MRRVLRGLALVVVAGGPPIAVCVYLMGWREFLDTTLTSIEALVALILWVWVMIALATRRVPTKRKAD